MAEHPPLQQAPKLSFREQVLLVLAILFCMTPFTSHILTHKVVHYHDFIVTGGTFIIPLWYQIGDIITEIYGYAITRRLTWITLIVCIFYAVIIELILPLNTPRHIVSACYELVLGSSLQISLASALGILAGNLINSMCIAKWKILVRGRRFWLRSLGSSFIAQTTYIFIASLLDLHNLLSNADLSELIVSCIGYEALFIIVFVPITSLVVYWLKQKIQDGYDVGVRFNPFIF